jgi:hypothetical protein
MEGSQNHEQHSQKRRKCPYFTAGVDQLPEIDVFF